MRINFDSEITRMDLIGRDVLSSEGGATISTFVDGILPQAMMGPYITVCDEIDFVRPDVAYVMQRAFEGNGLMLTEDGGRIVKPHKMFRMFATGNTVGQGDEYGMYQGARPQSMAMLDRFTVWIKVDYMSKGDRMKLLKSTAPNLDGNALDKINQYVGEHLEAFTTSKVLQPISPRTYMAFASAVELFTSMSVPDPIEQALSTTILDRASVQDRAVLNGLSNRVFK
jgi:cobaltochelatase CobS